MIFKSMICLFPWPKWHKNSFYFFALVLCGLSIACKKKTEAPRYDMAAQAIIDEDTIKSYLRRNNITDAIRTGSGLYYRITLAQPNAIRADSSKNVEVFYSGKFTDNRVFDSNVNQNSPFKFTIGARQVIRGWDIGMPYFRLGERGQLFIPSTLGYQNQASARIPANSVLIFDLQIYRVN